jgi:transposase-like protein
MTEETTSAPAAIQGYAWRVQDGQAQDGPAARLRREPTRSARRRPRPEDAAAQARAVELYTTTDLKAAEIAQELGISRAALYNWLAAAGVRGKRAEARPALADVAHELAELRSELHRSGALDTAHLAHEVKELRSTLTEHRSRHDAAISDVVRQIAALEAIVARLVGVVETVYGLRSKRAALDA